jgi:CheY-like chemotaxis protein
LDALQQESVDYILKGGRHLLGLINEILDIARVEAGRADLSIEPVMVAEVLEESFAMVRNAALDGGVVLDENLRAFEGVCVTADRQRLKQVFINLLSNAVKYNRSGGRVAARLSHDGEGTFRIAIEDTGLGVSEEGLSKLFLPFERLSPSASVEGTGLGLFLTRKLVAAMGGDIEVESRLGVGSTFSVALARAKVPTEAFLTLECLPMTLPYESGERPVSILSIEDNSANTRLMEMVLAARPDAVLTTATHGMDGLRAARQEEPDLILLDLNLPDVSGLEILKRLRRSATTAHVPVVVVSADASESKVDAALAAGADAFLTKPISVDRFLRTVDQHLLRSGAADMPLKEAA